MTLVLGIRRQQATQLAAYLCVVSVACGSSDEVVVNDNPDAADEVLTCVNPMPLVIGQCLEVESGLPCARFDDDEKQFIALEDEPTVQPIIGFQGSSMFVLSVAGEGIPLREPPEVPFVDVEILRGGVTIGAYTAPPSWELHQGQTQAPQLFVVSVGVEHWVDEIVDVTARVNIDEGEWCGQNKLQIGELIVPGS